MEKLTSKKIKDYLKTVINCPKWYIGKTDENQENAITIYTNRRQINKISQFKNLQTYGIIPITLLLRWTKNYDSAEEKANSIYELLDCSSFFIDSKECFMECLGEAPINLGTDNIGIYKFSIEINLIYKKGVI